MSKSNKKVVIVVDKGKKLHSTNWKIPWIEYCEKNDINYEVISSGIRDIISYIKKFDVLLWHFSGYNLQDMLFARSIIYSAKNLGLKVFPDFNDAWHFDDKIAETYLLQSVGAPIPTSHIFYDFKSVVTFTKDNPRFPVIAKLKNGSGSHNVKKIDNKKELISYAKQMFSDGISSSPNLLYKASSNIKSVKSFKTFIKRFKRIPEFLNTLRSSKSFNKEKGYVFLQDFISNDGFDLKIVVVGNKLSYIGRNIRKGEFRASGGGDLFYDKEYVSKNIIESAFTISKALGFQCMGYDYVVNSKTGKGYVVEISYGFSHTALLEAKGYFDIHGNWYDVPLNAPYEILKNMCT